ncbi:aldehyde dehydrogenase family protein, partial [Paenibacillus polymyxa]|nr:aldehyde dehydrogenase family protein [Paenibacillus polymyxa]
LFQGKDLRQVLAVLADQLGPAQQGRGALFQGKPLAEARGEIDYAASFIPWFAEQARRLDGRNIPSHIPGAHLGTVMEPVGVAVLLTPWNFPSAMITRKAAAALAAG